MANKQGDDNSHFSRFLRRFLKRQHKMLEIYEAITAGFKSELSTLQNSGSGKAKFEKLIQNFEEFESLKNSYFKYFEKQSSPEYAIEDISERISLYSALPKMELVEILSTTAYEHELMHHEIIYLSASALFFQSKFSSTSIKDIKTNSNRQTNKKLKDEINKRCLRHSLETLKERVSRPLKGSDYLEFIRVVEELHPEMPAPKKARITKDERRLTVKLQEEVLSEKQSKKWKLPTLRKFYKSETGLKATTKK